MRIVDLKGIPEIDQSVTRAVRVSLEMVDMSSMLDRYLLKSIVGQILQP